MISYRRVEKESDELLYTVWSLVMVRATNCQRKRLKLYSKLDPTILLSPDNSSVKCIYKAKEKKKKLEFSICRHVNRRFNRRETM